MVDDTGTLVAKSRIREARPSDSGAAMVPGVSFSVAPFDDTLAAKLAGFEGVSLYAPAQSIHWAQCWRDCVNNDLICATLSKQGKPCLVLILEVVSKKGGKIARFVGGRHANGNFPMVDPSCLPVINEKDIRALIDAIAAKRPDIDLVHLERQARELDGIANLLLPLATAESPNIALAADLGSGFDELLSSVNGKRKKKKHRSHTRKFEDDGGVEILQASTRAQSDRLLDFFFAAKAERFAKAGIENVFAETEVQCFFRELFGQCAGQDTAHHELNGLEVGGELRAVTGTSVLKSRIISEFGAVADIDTSRTSPGEFLYYENIREACENGFSIYDFSVGDEPYKRQWCLLETEHFDSVVPLTSRGKMLAMSISARSKLTRMVKRSPKLWKLVKKIRAGI